jgi:hypothetical protein
VRVDVFDGMVPVGDDGERAGIAASAVGTAKDVPCFMGCQIVHPALKLVNVGLLYGREPTRCDACHASPPRSDARRYVNHV